MTTPRTPEERRETQIHALKSGTLTDLTSRSALWALNDLLAYFDERERTTANMIRNGPPTVEQLAEIIRRIDGNHDKGAGELAELIIKELSK